MQKIVLATNNQHKAAEIKFMLDNLPLQILTADDFENFPDVEETGKTLEENAYLKARAIQEFTGLPSVADDSGLEVPVLNGAPGVHSARYAGPGCSFEDNNKKLLSELEGIPEQDRKAVFRCVIAICFDKDDCQHVEGKVSGTITTETAGENGFGYDPVFYHPFYKKTLAELPPEEKNKISHRALAINKAKELLIEKYELAVADE